MSYPAHHVHNTSAGARMRRAANGPKVRWCYSIQQSIGQSSHRQDANRRESTTNINIMLGPWANAGRRAVLSSRRPGRVLGTRADKRSVRGLSHEFIGGAAPIALPSNTAVRCQRIHEGRLERRGAIHGLLKQVNRTKQQITACCSTVYMEQLLCSTVHHTTKFVRALLRGAREGGGQGGSGPNRKLQTRHAREQTSSPTRSRHKVGILAMDRKQLESYASTNCAPRDTDTLLHKMHRTSRRRTWLYPRYLNPSRRSRRSPSRLPRAWLPSFGETRLAAATLPSHSWTGCDAATRALPPPTNTARVNKGPGTRGRFGHNGWPLLLHAT